MERHGVITMKLNSTKLNPIKTFYLLLSTAAYLCLAFLPNVNGLIIVLITFLIVFFAAIRNMVKPVPSRSTVERAFSLFFSVIVIFYTSYSFYRAWLPSGKIASLVGRFGISTSSFLIVLAAFGSCVAFCAVYQLMSWLVHLIMIRFREQSDPYEYKPSVSIIGKFRDNKSQGTIVFLVLLISAVGIITICSKSSPIYPFNNWVDSNCFMTVGKGMLSGKVPYRDLYEQKGPLLYALHGLAALVSRTSFLGVYFIEVIAAFFFLYFSWRILQLFCGGRAIIYIPVLSVIVYSSVTFAHGDSAEELCLPLLAYAFWVGLKALKNRKFPSVSESLGIGITSGCVLWIKYTLIGFYIGWVFALLLLLLRKNCFKSLFTTVGMIVAGVAISTLPWIIYFGLNEAIGDLFTVYFFDNMTYYVSNDYNHVVISVLNNGYVGWNNITTNFPELSISLIFCLVWAVLKKHGEIIPLVVFAFLAEFFVVYIGGFAHAYYAMAFGPFVIFAFPIVDHILDWVYRKLPSGRLGLPILLVLCLMLAFIKSPNISFAKQKQSDLPHYQFKEIIEQTPDATLLNYARLDLGLYTVCDIVPDCRYFCNLNSSNPAIMEGQNEYIKNKSADYVVTTGGPQEFLEENGYTCIATSQLTENEGTYTFYLYGIEQ